MVNNNNLEQLFILNRGILLWTSIPCLGAAMAVGSWLSIIISDNNIWKPIVILLTTIFLFSFLVFILKSFVQNNLKLTKEGNKSIEYLDFCLLICFGLLIFYPAWTWFSPGFRGQKELLSIFTISQTSPDTLVLIFPQFWINWTKILKTFISPFGEYLWLIWGLLAYSSIIVFFRFFLGLKTGIFISLLFATNLPFMLLAKTANSTLAAFFLLWSGILLLKISEEIYSLRKFAKTKASLNRNNWTMTTFSFLSALCFQEAMFIFPSILLIVVTFPFLISKKQTNSQIKIISNRHVFIYSLSFFIIIKLLIYRLIVFFRTKDYLLFSSDWIPSDGYHKFVLLLFTIIIILFFHHLALNHKRIKNFTFQINLCLTIIWSFFIWKLIKGPTNYPRLNIYLFSNNGVFLFFLLIGFVGILLSMLKNKDSLLYWLSTIFFITLPSGILYFDNPILWLHLQFIVVLILPFFYFGVGFLILQFKNNITHTNIIILIIPVFFFFSLHHDIPFLHLKWGNIQQEAVSKLLDRISPNSKLLISQENWKVMIFEIFKHHKQPVKISNKSLIEIENKEINKVVYTINLSESEAYSLNNRINVRDNFARYYDEPFPIIHSSWKQHNYLLEKLVFINSSLSPFFAKKSYTIELGFNDKGLLYNFNKRGRVDIDITYRWTKNRSWLKLPTIQKSDYIIEFELLGRFFPKNKELKLEIITQKGYNVGIITRQNHKVTLPKEQITIPVTYLLFKSQTFRPFGKNFDRREVGLPITKINVTLN